MRSQVLVISAIVLNLCFGTYALQTSSKQLCKCRSTDSCWPTELDWAKLNATVSGRLISAVPLGQPCHGQSFNKTLCNSLKAEWEWPLVYETTPVGTMNPWWQNGTCDPFHPVDSPCLKGNSPEYTIMAESAQDVKAGLKMAQDHNIRFTIHNTGHDFMGRSSGANALSIATVNLKSKTFHKSYNSSRYSGPAITVGSGLRGYEIYTFAHSYGYRAVGGDCPTVGLAGGYIQGGGHGSLVSLYGMAADQVLEWEAVLPNGTVVTATPDQHPDLYWALAGGGGGTFAIVLSVTIRVFQDIGPISGAQLSIIDSSPLPTSVFWSIVSGYHASLPDLFSSGGGTEEHEVAANKTFAIARLTAPRWTEQQVRQYLSPITTKLDKYNVTYSLNVTTHPTFWDHYVYYQGPIPAGRYPISILAHSRLVPLQVISSPAQNAALTRFLQNSTEQAATSGVIYGCVSMNATAHASVAPNAILPAWRTAAMHCIISLPFDFTNQTTATKEKMLQTLMDDIAPRIREVTPKAGTYANEGNWDLETWKEDFYGSNWDRLSSIKSQVDPEGLLYGIRNVGSEKWNLHNDGSLCKAN